MHILACARRPFAALGLQALHQQIASALGSGIGFALNGVDGDLQLLWPVERAVIAKAIPRRQREFAAGRAAAREAMARIGWAAQAVPSAPDRSPVWPKGLVGSIAHSNRVCVAMAGRSNQVHAIGIDVEEDVAMHEDHWETICTPSELAVISTLPSTERGRWVTRIFCIKEAFYKWQYPQTRRMLAFLDVQVTLSQDRSAFSVTSVEPSNAPLPTCIFEGSLMTVNGLALAWVVGPPSATMENR